MKGSRVFLLLPAVAALLLMLPSVVVADNCSSLSDCYRTAQAAIAATVGVGLFAVVLSVALEAIPGVGTVKSVIEAVTGRDLVTGAELAWWERALGIVPLGGAIIAGGVGIVKAGKVLNHLDDVGSLGRAAGRISDGATLSRVADRMGDATGLSRHASRSDDIADAIRRASDWVTENGGKVLNVSDNVWKMPPFKRGRAIEEIIDPPGFIRKPANFPVIDGYHDGLATGVKSIDLAAPSYRNLRNVERAVKGYVDKLANFNGGFYWGKKWVDPVDKRVLDLAIPNIPLSPEHVTLLKNLQAYASNKVELILTVVKASR